MRKIVFVLLTVFIFIAGCNGDKVDLNSKSVKKDDKIYEQSDKNLVEDNKKQSNHIPLKEEVIFSFKTKKGGKRASINFSKENNYIFYRFTGIDKIELEYPKNKENSWKKFVFLNYRRGGGEQNLAMDLNSLYFINDNYLYEIYDDYKNSDRYVGIRVTNRTSNEVTEIEGNREGASWSLLFLDQSSPKIGNELNYVNQLEGNWTSIDRNQNHGTNVNINFTSIIEFNIKIEAYQLNAQGQPHIGLISGIGTVKDSKISFTADYGELTGEIVIDENKIRINYVGNTMDYAGLNVSFANEFIKNK